MAAGNKYWIKRINEWTSLDPTDRLSEVLFGLIMVLTFTCTISTSTSGRQDLDQLLWAALGCNIAWGLVDGIMNMMDTLINRAHSSLQFTKLKEAETTKEVQTIVRNNISPLLAEVINDDEMVSLGQKIKALPDSGEIYSLTLKDFLIAAEIFLLVFLSTLPVVLPFVFLNDVLVAIRISNLIAIVCMMAVGYMLARYAGLHPLKTAMVYTGLGITLVIITMALGG